MPKRSCKSLAKIYLVFANLAKGTRHILREKSLLRYDHENSKATLLFGLFLFLAAAARYAQNALFIQEEVAIRRVLAGHADIGITASVRVQLARKTSIRSVFWTWRTPKMSGSSDGH
jgi:hypothetical protein